jgi:uncharacterized protein YbaR (Trm112 family)
MAHRSPCNQQSRGEGGVPGRALRWPRSASYFQARTVTIGMRRDLMDILACPVCKGELELTVEQEKGKEVVAGTLRCASCRHDYPIKDSIPDLRPPGSV